MTLSTSKTVVSSLDHTSYSAFRIECSRHISYNVVTQVWALLISGMLWNICTTTFLILINDFVLRVTDMNNEEVALGITLLGEHQVL